MQTCILVVWRRIAHPFHIALPARRRPWQSLRQTYLSFHSCGMTRRILICRHTLQVTEQTGMRKAPVKRGRQERLRREGDKVLQNWASARLHAREERRRRRQTATGPQDDESRAIREAARHRMAEQRKRDREALRQQRLRIRFEQEEEQRRKQTETIRQQEENGAANKRRRFRSRKRNAAANMRRDIYNGKKDAAASRRRGYDSRN